jgi:hypothetical protein
MHDFAEDRGARDAFSGTAEIGRARSAHDNSQMTNDRFEAAKSPSLRQISASFCNSGFERLQTVSGFAPIICHLSFAICHARSSALCLIVSLVCGAGTALAAEPSGLIRIENRWPQVFQILANSATDTPVRTAKLADYLREQCPEIAERLGIAQMTPDDSRRYLFELEQRSFAIRSIARRFNAIHSNLEEQFIKTFPDFHPERKTIYLTLSRFRFDGKVPHDRLDSLLLAFDGIAKFHGAKAPVAVIFSHELFHLYHFQINPPPADPDQLPLYRLIWQEGLACYVSSTLNPTAPLSDVLFDPRLATDGPKFVKPVAHQLLMDLSSTDDVQTAQYLTYRVSNAIPPRMGYLIGYLIVAKLAKDHSLVELAHLRDSELRLTMRREVRQLAEEP